MRSSGSIAGTVRPPFDVYDLWRRRVDVVAANLAADLQEHREIANVAAQIAIDYHGRFLTELIQNASDQATRARRRDATITIVRTADVLAVFNEGLPFDDKGAEALTSLALGDKDGGECLGNKGVGFKSVFEVSAAPEIYSVADKTGHLRDGARLLFGFDLEPTKVPAVSKRLRSLVKDTLGAQPSFADTLRRRGLDPVRAVMDELGTVASWKLPIQRSSDELQGRLEDLVPPDSRAAEAQTLVVLPLLKTANTGRDVSLALRALTDQAGLLLVFLPSVGCIDVWDQVLQSRVTFHRETHGRRAPEDARAGVRLEEVTVRVGGAIQEEARWWVARRTIGRDGPANTAKKEATAIHRAASKLPGQAFAKVDHAPVAVALRRPAIGDRSCAPLPAEGRFCIGLPTEQPTGTPFWVDGHFHGTISRTGVDVAHNPYNELLFDEAVLLTGDLVAALRTADELYVRRCVTRVWNRKPGQLADRLWQPRGLAHDRVVLGWDGVAFLRGRELSLPAHEDLDAALDLLDVGASSAAGGFQLADHELMVGARPCLDALMKEGGGQVGRERYLARVRNGLSLVERAARRTRDSGPKFWNPFLEWLTDRFPRGELDDQLLLPVGHGDLARANEKVFLARGASPRAPSAGPGGEFEVEDIPEAVQRLLRILDDSAVQTRTGRGRDRTELANTMVMLRLVRAPRIDELVNDALVPQLRALTAKKGRAVDALRLLEQALRWIGQADEKTAAKLRVHELQVPVGSKDAGIAWSSPAEVYFGKGWLDEKSHEDGLEAAYGTRLGARLLPWAEFAQLDDKADRIVWFQGMCAIGVAQWPRVIRSGIRVAFQAVSYDSLGILEGTSCPIAAAAPWWRPYLEAVRRRRVSVCTWQRYCVEDVVWVDGLESDATRNIVFDLMMSRPDEYSVAATTRTRRVEGHDGLEAPTLWRHALQTAGWNVIPVERRRPPMKERRPTQRALLLSVDQTERRSLDLLPAVRRAAPGAARLLNLLGVPGLGEVSCAWVIWALQELASIPNLTRLRRDAEPCSAELYELLQKRAAEGGSLAALANANVPLLVGESLLPTDLRELDIVYLVDDPLRANWILELSLKPRFPSLRNCKPLAAAINRALGRDLVVCTSDAPVELGFVPGSDEAPVPVLDYLQKAFSDVAVHVDLGLLRAFGGQQDANPRDAAFRQWWAKMRSARVLFGRFTAPRDASVPPVYLDGDRLLVDRDLPAAAVVESTWLIAGPAHRDRWAAYASALSSRSQSRFLAERQLTQSMRAEVEAAIGAGFAGRLRAGEAIVLALWRRVHVTEALEAFSDDWPVHAATTARLAKWLGNRELASFLEGLALAEDEEAAFIVGLQTVDASSIQRARGELGLAPLRLTSTIRQLDQARRKLVAEVAASAAMDITSDLASIGAALQAAVGSGWPAEVCERQFEDKDAASVAARALRTRLKAAPNGAVRFLARIRRQPRSEARWRSVADTYERDDEGTRVVNASIALDNLLRVGSALAILNGEPFERLRERGRVPVFEFGFWANARAALAALRAEMAQIAPLTAAGLAKKGAFDNAQLDPTDLWRKFPQLGRVSPGTAVKPVRRVLVLDYDPPIDGLERDLSLGSAGEAGKKLQAAVFDALDLKALAQVERSTVTLSQKGARAPSRGAGGNWNGGTFADAEWIGLIGEAFVYEQLRQVLSGFGPNAWVSTNAAKYGIHAHGDDRLGRDFDFNDVQRAMVGPGDPTRCYIEVKSTTQTATGAFPMTAGEWRCAEACHRDRNATYIIVRVADVRSRPRIADIVVDPFGLYVNGRLGLDNDSFLVDVGKRI